MTEKLHDRRFSDRLSFWIGVFALLTLAHFYLLPLIFEVMGYGSAAYLWITTSFVALLSSFAAGRIGALHHLTPSLTLQSALSRFGSTWNMFIFFTSVFVFVISRLSQLLMPLAPERIFSLAVMGGFSLCLYGLIEARTIVTVNITLYTDSLPPGRRRLRIVQLSDLHIGPFMNARHIGRVTSAAFDALPDLVVITGDIVDGDVNDQNARAPFYRAFSTVLASLSAFAPELGVWAVPGNHDYYDGEHGSWLFIKESGVKLLRTQKVDLGDIVIVGADDRDHLIRSRKTPSLTRSEALLASLSQDEAKKFVLLLRHRPAIETASLGKFDLQLSGHTHGGQLLTLPSSNHRFPGRSKGLARLGGHACGGKESWLYVSNGAGFVGPPMRFLSPPEVVVIDLIAPEREERQG